MARSPLLEITHQSLIRPSRERLRLDFGTVRGWIALSLVALVLQGCATSSRARFCSSELPLLEVAYDNAVLALGPWLDAGRQPASEGGGPGFSLPERDRDYWADWAEARLKAVQSTMDLAEAENRGGLRRELSQLANELVVFHGYSVSGRADKMAASIQKLKLISKRVQARGCPHSTPVKS